MRQTVVLALRVFGSVHLLSDRSTHTSIMDDTPSAGTKLNVGAKKFFKKRLEVPLDQMSYMNNAIFHRWSQN
jgi:hypothetical protein